MNFDLRLPIGIMFTLFGAMLLMPAKVAAYGAAHVGYTHEPIAHT